MVHRRRKQREHEPKHTPQKARGGGGGRRVVGVSINNVTDHRRSGRHETAAEDGDADVRDEPEGVVLRGPAVDEETGGDEDCAGEHERNAVFGGDGAGGFEFEAGPDTVGDWGGGFCADEFADHQGKVVEARGGDGFVVGGCPERGESGDYEEEDAVIECKY